MKSCFWHLVFLLFFLSSETFGQSIQQLERFEEEVQETYRKVYQASVKLFEADSVRGGSGRFVGSGVVVSAEGLILTVAHVNKPGVRYRIVFPNGREAIGRGLGEIGSLDAAMMQIEDEGSFPFAPIGRSANLQVGQPCISLGYAAGLKSDDPALRLGFVVRVAGGDREEGRGRRNNNRLQTTCLMEPGDSGGPVFDLEGHVIGLRSSINQPLDANFEVPADIYLQYWDVLHQTGEHTLSTVTAQSLAAVQPAMPTFSYIPYSDTTSFVLKQAERLPFSTLTLTSRIGDTIVHAVGTLIDMKELIPKKARRGKTFLLSKSSIVGDTPTVLISGKKQLTGKVVARDDARDLVLLEVKTNIKKGHIDLALSVDSVLYGQVGAFIYSILPDNNYRVSVVGAKPYSIAGISRSAYLGAALEQRNDGLYLSMVQDHSPAKLSGLQVGQRILSIDGVVPTSPHDFVRLIQRKKPWDTLHVESMQDDEQVVKDIVLANRPLIEGPHIAERFDGGKSIVRDGFTHVFPHDGRIRPEECGSPVVDRSGRFYGLNIARVSRTGALVTPAEEIRSFLKEGIKSSNGR